MRGGMIISVQGGVMGGQEDKQRKVIDLAEMRKRQRTLLLKSRKGATKTAMKSKSTNERTLGNKLWGVIQFIVFMALFAYMVQLCRGR